MKTLVLSLLVSLSSMAYVDTMNVQRVLVLNGQDLSVLPASQREKPPVALKLCEMPDEDKTTLVNVLRYALKYQKAVELKLDRDRRCVLAAQTFFSQRNIPQ